MAIIGVDEVGRGAWAGPLLICAVLYTNHIDGLRDSKKLSKNKREQLAAKIVKYNKVGYGWVSSDEIDDHGLGPALKMAAARALVDLDYDNEEIITDGNVNFYDYLINSKYIIKADDTVPAVSAASIVAKVTRDLRMQYFDELYPAYDLSKNVGYGTASHKKAIELNGLCPLHRKSFKI